MFNKIMVPIDVSDGNKWALATALELAQQTRARLTLIHVIQRVAGIQPGELRRFYRRLLTISERKLKRAARQFAAKGVSVRTEVHIGEPVAEIVRAAAKNKIDLMVMGSHSVDVTRPTRGWGTISYRVGLLCQCPILLVKRRETGPEPKRAARRQGPLEVSQAHESLGAQPPLLARIGPGHYLARAAVHAARGLTRSLLSDSRG